MQEDADMSEGLYLHLDEQARRTYTWNGRTITEEEAREIVNGFREAMLPTMRDLTRQMTHYAALLTPIAIASQRMGAQFEEARQRVVADIAHGLDVPQGILGTWRHDPDAVFPNHDDNPVTFVGKKVPRKPRSATMARSAITDILETEYDEPPKPNVETLGGWMHERAQRVMRDAQRMTPVRGPSYDAVWFDEMTPWRQELHGTLIEECDLCHWIRDVGRYFRTTSN
jgi:hypothetical protein